MSHPSRFVEPLEHRRLLAGQQTLIVGQRFVGNLPVVDQVVLIVSAPLDPVTAANPKSYALYRNVTESHDGFNGIGEGSDTTKQKVQFASAVYDAAAGTVTLTPKEKFGLGDSLRFLKIRGAGDNAMKMADGAVIDGDGNGKVGGDAVVQFRKKAGRSTTIVDADGDKATIKLTGPGKFVTFLPRRGNPLPIVYVNSPTPAANTVVATVKKGKKGDGVVHMEQFDAGGVGGQNVIGNPAFSIEHVNAGASA